MILRKVLIPLLFLALPALAREPPVSRYGAPIAAAGKPIKLAQLLANPDGYAGKSVLVEGTVRAACTRRGCWMELAQGVARGTQGCRVTFKDYGFFVPTDSAGAGARVEGVVSVRTVPPAEVQHFESEGASFQKKDTDGSAREIRIVATGVELRR
jgi:hypothetical protein